MSFFVVATDVVLFIMLFFNGFGCLDYIVEKNCFLLRILNEMLLSTSLRDKKKAKPFRLFVLFSFFNHTFSENISS